MSANNEIRIQKRKNKWIVKHWDLDCGEISKIGEFKTLEKAIHEANQFEKESEQALYGIEYGIRVVEQNYETDQGSNWAKAVYFEPQPEGIFKGKR